MAFWNLLTVLESAVGDGGAVVPNPGASELVLSAIASCCSRNPQKDYRKRLCVWCCCVADINLIVGYGTLLGLLNVGAKLLTWKVAEGTAPRLIDPRELRLVVGFRLDAGSGPRDAGA